MKVSFLVLAVGGALCAQQQSWIELSVTSRPFARQRHAMVYDIARQEIVVFGGNNGAYMNDTWVLGSNSNAWAHRLPAASPSPRESSAIAYDPVRQRVVLLGGYDGTELSDIWEWDGSNWSQRATGVSGVSSTGAACYDPTQGGVFFNRNSVNLLWNGTTAQTVTVTQPTAYIRHRLVFDAASGGVITVFGQYTKRFSVPNGWQTLNTSFIFSLNDYAMAVDPLRQRVFLQGGSGTVGGSSGDWSNATWQWTGALWQQTITDQWWLCCHQMVFDPVRDRCVIFGGRTPTSLFDRTLVLQPSAAPAAYQTFGIGCAGTGTTTPDLRPDPLWNSAPILGGLFFLRLEQLPPSQPAFGAIGGSDQSWNGQPLPLPLAAIGMPACDLLVSMDVSVGLGLSSPSGTLTWVTAIPNVPPLLGQQFFQQAAVFAPGVNPANLLVSNGGHGTVGLR